MLRARIRGYRLLSKNDRIGSLRKIRSELVGLPFAGLAERASRHLFGKSVSQAELVVRQFALQRYAGAALNEKVLESLGQAGCAIVYPLPLEWRRNLRSHGLNVAETKSRLAWFARVMLHLGNGILVVARLTAIALLATLRRAPVPAKRYAYFQDLALANLPRLANGAQGYNICSWYVRWSGRCAGLESIRHSVPGAQDRTLEGYRVEYANEPFHLLRGGRNILRFMVWGAIATLIAAVDLLRGRWWHALILAEAARAKAVQLCAAAHLAGDYLFHFSGTMYRPMWTYEAEAKGARIICYFYSTYRQVKLPGGYASQRFEWGDATWPLYLVWDRYQADQLRLDIDKRSSIEIVGPIWFSDSDEKVKQLPARSIAVFDVQPHRRAVHFGISTIAEYLAQFPAMHTQFVEDVYSILHECGATMAFKKKRDIGRRAVKKYRNLIERISGSPDVVMIDPGISPIKVIEKCIAVISMPFTSTALYLRDQSIPSAYYDPTGWLQKDDLGAHGLPILSGVEELRDWIKTVMTRSE